MSSNSVERGGGGEREASVADYRALVAELRAAASHCRELEWDGDGARHDDAADAIEALLARAEAAERKHEAVSKLAAVNITIATERAEAAEARVAELEAAQGVVLRIANRALEMLEEKHADIQEMAEIAQKLGRLPTPRHTAL